MRTPGSITAVISGVASATSRDAFGYSLLCPLNLEDDSVGADDPDNGARRHVLARDAPDRVVDAQLSVPGDDWLIEREAPADILLSAPVDRHRRAPRWRAATRRSRSASGQCRRYYASVILVGST